MKSAPKDNRLVRDSAAGLLEIRDKWHVKNHPLYVGFASGEIGLNSIGALLAQQYHHIKRVLPSLGLVYYKAPADCRGFVLRQLVTEDGYSVDNQGAVSSMEMCLRFCRIAGLTEEQVKSTEPSIVWRARAYYYITIAHEESFATYIAMKSITEGQQVGINRERVLPALEAIHGYKAEDPAIQYFVGQFIADEDVGKKLVEFAANLIDSPSQQQRAFEVAETAAKYYWQAVDDIYRNVAHSDLHE